MVRKTIRKVKRWLGRALLNRARVEQLTKSEIETRIWKLEDQRDRIKNEMDSLKSDFDEVVEKAKHASEDEVQELKTTASTLLSKYKAKRYQWSKVHAGLNYYEQAALQKDIQHGGVTGLPSEADPVAIQRATERWKGEMEKDRETVRGIQSATDQMEGVHEGGASTMESIANGQASDIIDAAREGESVPTIDELADQAYASDQSNHSSEDQDPMPADMGGFPGK